MKTYLRILSDLGWPKVYLISPKQYEMIEGFKLYKKNPDGTSYTGFASPDEHVITSHHGLRGKVLVNNLAHEILHVLYPWRHEWWIECAAELYAKGGGRGYYSDKYGHSPADLPPRNKVLLNIRRQVARFNRRSK